MPPGPALGRPEDRLRKPARGSTGLATRNSLRSFTRRSSLLRLLLAFLALLASAPAAFAHASLLSAVPADGAVLAAAPAEFTLTFDEPVSPLILKLVEHDGHEVPLAPALHGTAVTAPAPQPLERGTHILSWRVISADGHPVGGSIVFSIGAPSAGPAPPLKQAEGWPIVIATWLSRLVLYAGLFGGAGGAFFLAWLAPGERAGRRLMRPMLIAGLAAACLSVGLEGVDALALPLNSLFGAAVWKTGLLTSYGLTALLAGAALLGALLALKAQNGRTAQALSLAALLLVGGALAASGHASAAQPQWLMRPAVFLHAVAVAFWAGALLPLGLLLVSKSAAAPGALAGFSRLIPYTVALAVLAGLALAVVQVGRPQALVETLYGRVLLAKLLLVLALLAVAAVNRWRLTPLAGKGDGGAARRLGRLAMAEVALVAAILAAVAVWRFTPPPRALAAAAAAAVPASVHLHGEKAMAELTVAPGHAGPVSVSISLASGDLGALPAKEVTLVLSRPDKGIEPIRREARRIDEAEWRVDGLTLPVAGRWKVAVEVLVSDFDMARLEGTVTIGP